ncbi:actin-binding protein IPP-like [Phlebotomus argentipes]|uniref:actin-binding protein IPP-like n=1 Tax=Phlebotomus argentipes TaxID=94469 RepID=UPI002892C719|nr:actin-binding protein IPP-like [Phlebotomus argentipes]
MDSTSSVNSARCGKRLEFGSSPDICFIFPNHGGAIITAEKFALAKKSELFEKQFPPSRNEIDATSERVAITEISVDTFAKFVKHIYGTAIDIDEENYLELLYASTKYFVDDLTHMIVEFLKGFLDSGNVVQHFEFIEKFNIKMLNDYMKRLFVKFPLDVIKSLTISAPHKRILKMILKSPFLPVSEFDLYKAILKMKCLEQNVVHHGERLRKDLGKLIYLIRFPCMTVKELISCGETPTLLTHKELVDFLLWVEKDQYSDTIRSFSTDNRIQVVLSSNLALCTQCRAAHKLEKFQCTECSKDF